MAKSSQRRNSVIKGSGGEKPPPEKVVLRGMANLEKALARRFQDRKKQLARLAGANAPVRDKLLGVFGKDPAWAASVRRERRAARKSLASRRVAISKTLPRKPGTGVFVSTNGGAHFPPFDYAWTWSTGNGPDPVLRADRFFGGLQVNVDGDIFAGGVDAYAAVGIFFRLPSFGFFRLPYFRLANLTVSANPSVYFGWTAFFDAKSEPFCGSVGSIGLFVQQLTIGTQRPPPPLLSSQEFGVPKISLWSDSSLGLNGSGWGLPRVSVPLSANFLVDADHWYVLWVWCGTDDWAIAPEHPDGSWVGSELSVNVPSVNWQFDPLHELPSLP